HKKPNAAEINACRPWLEAEIQVVKPRVIICLGSTAAQALLGPKFRVTTQRGTFVPSPLAPFVTATVHPSSILRAPTDEQRRDQSAKELAAILPLSRCKWLLERVKHACGVCVIFCDAEGQIERSADEVDRRPWIGTTADEYPLEARGARIDLSLSKLELGQHGV